MTNANLREEPMAWTNPAYAEGRSRDHGPMAACIDGGDILRLRELVIIHAIRGEVAKRVVEYLFGRLGERICAQDISENGGPKGDGNVCPFMSRLRDQLSEFFNYHPAGRREPYRSLLPGDDRGNYSLQIEANKPPSGFARGFWGPHFSDENPLVAYPVIQLCNTSIFNDLTSDDCVAEPEQDHPIGIPVVSQSIMRSVFRLSESFRTWQVGVTPIAVRSSVDMLDADNLIVLGTPGSMPLLLPNLEASSHMTTGRHAVTVMPDSKDRRKTRTYSFLPENGSAGNALESVTWGVFTRHRYPFQRTLTIVAAQDEFAVEPMLQFLLNEEALLLLAKELQCGQAFPDHFQILFRMHLVKSQPYASEIAIEETIISGTSRKSPLLEKCANVTAKPRPAGLAAHAR